jgi:hypothetical protein
MPVRPPQNRQKPIYAASRYVSHDNPLFLMNLLRTKYIAMLDAALSGQGITAAQWGILRMIFDGRGNTAAALCRHYGYDTGSMTVTSGVTEAVTALNHYVSGFSGDEVETLTGFLRRMLTNADTDPS